MAEIRREQTGECEVITLSGDLTVPHARSIRAALQEAMRSAARIEVVIGGAASTDVSFPQVLCAAHRTAVRLRKDLSVRGVEEGPVAQLLRETGFQRQVGCRDIAGAGCLWRRAEERSDGPGADGHDRR